VREQLRQIDVIARRILGLPKGGEVMTTVEAEEEEENGDGEEIGGK
jgi:hypothetical protein